MIEYRSFIVMKALHTEVIMYTLKAKKIIRLSALLRYTALALLGIAPLFTAMFWISNGEQVFPWIKYTLPEGITNQALFRPIAELSPFHKLFGFIVDLIPTCFFMAALGYLARLFRLFSQQEFFTASSVQCIRRVGIILLIGQLFHPFYIALLSLALTISNPPGSRLIAVEVGISELGMIAVAFGIILVSWIMDEGRKLQEEQENTI